MATSFAQLILNYGGFPSKLTVSPQEVSSNVINNLEQASNQVKGTVDSNGGNPDGIIGINDLDAIINNTGKNGVTETDAAMAKAIKDHLSDSGESDIKTSDQGPVWVNGDSLAHALAPLNVMG